MHCISLAIFNWLSQFPSPQLAQIDLSVFTCRYTTNQPTNNWNVVILTTSSNTYSVVTDNGTLQSLYDTQWVISKYRLFKYVWDRLVSFPGSQHPYSPTYNWPQMKVSNILRVSRAVGRDTGGWPRFFHGHGNGNKVHMKLWFLIINCFKESLQ